MFLFNITFAQAEDCREEWVCKDWSSCKDGLKTRTCNDKNNCGTDLYKPFESMPCVEGEDQLNAKSELILNNDLLFIAIGATVLIIGGIIYLHRKKKK